MLTTHNFPMPPGTSADLHNKMDDAISHMTMMVIILFLHDQDGRRHHDHHRRHEFHHQHDHHGALSEDSVQPC
jgi:hypothetical protein